ncbi:---NA--- [Paramuricea clavata]|uniref:---NA n=1 Tax=Paramuricea clavata TaxID=317549 RepID=A0A6S7GMA9_PARCT|nr:---NA--- [Paramuricea clavata]
MNGELQYVEKLPVDNPILCAAVSPCNSIILMASSELTFHVWRKDQTSQPLHWVASNTGKLFSRMEGSKESVFNCKCCITSDSTKGVLALYFCERLITKYPVLYYFILDDLNSKIKKRMIQCHNIMLENISNLGELYVGNSYCIVVEYGRDPWFGALRLATAEYAAEWKIFRELRCFPLIGAHSKNDLVAVITQRPASVQFLKIVVPE